MRFISALFRLLSAIFLLAFAGAVLGGCAGLMLVGLDLLELRHLLWLVEADALLCVV